MSLNLFLLVLSTQAASQPQPPAPIVVTGQLPDDQKKVCRNMEEEIGSIIPQRVCRTKGEWAAIKKRDERRTRAYVQDKNAMSGRTPARQESGQ